MHVEAQADGRQALRSRAGNTREGRLRSLSSVRVVAGASYYLNQPDTVNAASRTDAEIVPSGPGGMSTRRFAREFAARAISLGRRASDAG